MENLKTITWLCLKDGEPHRVTGKGINLTAAFKSLPDYRQREAVHGLIGVEINGVKL